MKGFRVRAIARKEFIHILRDPRSLGLAIAIPMVMLILFGYALTLDVDRVPFVVWDQDETPQSREFISRMTGSRYFSIAGHAHSYVDIEKAIDSRKAIMAINIPHLFSRDIDDGNTAIVQLILDGSDSNTATIALGYANAITALFSEQSFKNAMQKKGGKPPDPPIEVRARVWYNEELESKNFIFPGLLGVIMMIIAALLTSLTVAREWERGTMEQLISTPILGSELILGKLIPYFFIGLFDMFIGVLMGQFLFHIPFRGDVVYLFVMASIFLAGSQSMGILISVVSKTQLIASQLAILTTFLPSFLLSGFMYPISSMPPFIQLFSYLVPARYFTKIIKSIYLKGVGIEVLLIESLLLTCFALVVYFLAVSKFKKKLE